MRATIQASADSGILLLAGCVFLGLAGCGAAFAPPPNTIDMDAVHWNLLYGSRVPSHPAPSQPGWQFDIPAAPGSVHYVQVPFKATEDLTGKTLTVTFRMVSNNPVYSAKVEPGETDPPSFHLFLEHANDDLSNQYYRWWCMAGGYYLGTQENQTITISCPLTYEYWSSVYARVDQNQFTETLKNLGGVGVTFGGAGGLGHGVNLLGGSAQFQVLDARIGDPAPTATVASSSQ